MSDIIEEMNKLKIVKIDQKWRLAEISDKQNDLFKKLRVDVPADTSYYE